MAILMKVGSCSDWRKYRSAASARLPPCNGWVVDLGPEGGDRGGEVVATGSPEEIAGRKDSYTGHYLALALSGHGLPDDEAVNR